MNPIILYPKNAAQAKIFRETAEKKGVEMVCIPKKAMADIEERVFAKKLVARSKNTKNVGRKKMMTLFDRKLKELSEK